MQLEVATNAGVNVYLSNFNSILVQLEAGYRMDQPGVGHEFQFHIGAIRSELRNNGVAAVPEFQFHIGAIRSIPCR